MIVCEAKVDYTKIRNIDSIAIDAPEKAVEYLQGAFDPFRESIWIIPVNTKNKAICRERLTVGTLTASLVSAADVLRAVLRHEGAAGFVLAHNHPSGDPAPSQADCRVTRAINKAAEAVDLSFLDHVVVGRREDDPRGVGFYSFQGAGYLG